MTLFEFLTSTVIALYAGASLVGMLGIALRRPLLKKIGVVSTIAAFVAQTAALFGGIHAILPQGLSWGAYLHLMAWFCVACSLVGLWRFKASVPLLFSAPFALVFFCMALPYGYNSLVLPQHLSTPFYALHIGSLFLSLGCMTLACGAALLFLLQEKRLKSKSPVKGFLSDMPSLGLLDRINATAVTLGFPLYTLGIISGCLWAQPAFGASFSGDPKEIVSCVVWVLYAMLFHNRFVFGWKGRKPAQLIIAVFLLSLFSVVCVNMFMTTHHSIFRQ